MSNGPTHRFGSAVVIGGLALVAESGQPELSAKPIVAASLAYLTGTLPDILEPALHPNHRKFFHSLGFASTVAYGLYKASQWEPETETDKWLRFTCLAVGGAYLVHLAMDATTPKGLPVI